MNDETTKQFWAGEFGDEYHRRQKVTHEANVALMRRILETTGKLVTVAELGAGAGLNLRAMSTIDPDMWLCGVEINAQAVREMLTIPRIQAVECSVDEWRPTTKFDMTFTKGLLIHIPPAQLPNVYKALVEASRRWVLVCEYFNPTPVEVPYRGHAGRLWKRDFAGELIDQHGLQLVDYGFAYSRGTCPQDNITWFLMEKP